MKQIYVALKHTLLRRAGKTSQYWSESYIIGQCTLDLALECVTIDCQIPSKGGGTTALQLEISLIDLTEIMGVFLKEKPDAVKYQVSLIPPSEL